MPNQEELRKIAENIDSMSLLLDDTFQFSCKGCGDCCRNREDILLSSRDIFNIAKQLRMTTGQVKKTYCDCYIGESSRLPIIRLQPKGPFKSCPLLSGNRCRVHAVKPSVCALYPLGRYLKNESSDETIKFGSEIGYLINPIYCGRDEIISVREWLDKFNIPVDDPFFISWYDCAATVGSFIKLMEDKNLPDDCITWVIQIVAIFLYLEYDTSQAFMPQFENNKQFILQLIIRLKNSPAGIQGAIEHHMRMQKGA